VVIVDSHCHASLAWYEPIETLLHEMDRNGVDHAVLIQILGQTNNGYQQACLPQYAGRVASVVLVDPALPDAVQTLEKLVAEGATGVRLRPAARSSGDDSLAIWRAAGRLNLSVSCPGTSEDFASGEFTRLVAALPEVRIVVEHLGSVSAPDTDDQLRTLRQQAFGLAQYPNVAIKFGGFGEIAQRAQPAQEPFPFVEPVPAYLDQAYEAFGPDRMMWGSDFPPVAGREGYANALRLPREHFARLPIAEQEKLFGGTALRYFPLPASGH
jgi:L-fuconolactonase